jgi:hypothetical protein
MDMLTYLYGASIANRVEKVAQQQRYDRLRDRGSARRRAEALEERLEDLEHDVGEMALFVRTLWRILAEKGTIDRAEFVQVARAIDAQDGTADGRYTGPIDAP